MHGTALKVKKLKQFSLRADGALTKIGSPVFDVGSRGAHTFVICTVLTKC